MERTRTYFVRTRNRSRILETLVCRIVDGRLAFGIARAPRSDSSPSRKKGREDATKRLDEAIAAYGNGEKFVYRKPHAKHDEGGVPRTMENVMGGVLNVNEVVPTLYDILLGGFPFAMAGLVPAWVWKQDNDALAHFPEYHDMLCKLRNCVERGRF